MKTVEQILAERIKYFRGKRGWKQADLAAELELSHSAIAQIETGRIWPSIETVRKLAKVFNIPEPALFTDHMAIVHVQNEPTVEDAVILVARKALGFSEDEGEMLRAAIENIVSGRSSLSSSGKKREDKK